MQVLLKCLLKQNRWGYESRTGITVSFVEKQSSEGSSQRLHIMKKTESTTSSAVLHKSKVKQNVTKPKGIKAINHKSGRWGERAAQRVHRHGVTCPSKAVSRPGQIFMPNTSPTAVPLMVLSANTHLSTCLDLLYSPDCCLALPKYSHKTSIFVVATGCLFFKFFSTSQPSGTLLQGTGSGVPLLPTKLKSSNLTSHCIFSTHY